MYVLCISVLVHPIIIFKFSRVNFHVIQPLDRRAISEVCLTYKFPFYNHVCVAKGGVVTMDTLNQSLQQWLT